MIDLRLSLLLLLSFSSISYSKIKYDPLARKCPLADSKNHYISVPLIHDLESIAKIENIPNLQLHAELLEESKGMELSVYYELISTFDKNKDLVILIPGGPGVNHSFIHDFVDSFKGRSDFFEKYNVIAMDHRGLGCSKALFPGNEPPESLTMKFAASDIELIRKNLSPDKKIHVWGYSYGSMLAQTYALLFPDSVNKLFLGGAFSAAEDFKQAKRDYEELVATSSVGVDTYRNFVEKYPDFKIKFLDYTVNQMYSYKGRIQNIPETLKTITSLLELGETHLAQKILSNEGSYIMPWMMRSISCLEIFDPTDEEGSYPMFAKLFGACREFGEDIVDFFNYTESLAHLQMKTFIWGGKYDHVTPAKAMIKMSNLIPNNFLYIDQHVGHGVGPKLDCFIKFMDSFFDDSPINNLKIIASSSKCQLPPVVNK